MKKNDNELKDKSVFLFDVIKRYDHYIGTTNFKVALIVSFLATVILGLTMRIMFLTQEESEISCLFKLAIIFSITTILFSLVAMVQLFRVIFPNTKSDEDYKSLIFYGDVATSENGAEGYTKKIIEVNPKDLVVDLAKQTYIVAEIVNEKFRTLKVAVNIVNFLVLPLLTVSLILLIVEGVN